LFDHIPERVLLAIFGAYFVNGSAQPMALQCLLLLERGVVF